MPDQTNNLQQNNLNNSLNTSSEKSKVKFISVGIIILLLLVLAFFAYSYFNSSKLRTGPVVKVNTPEEGIVVKSPTVFIEGGLENVARMFINGKEIIPQDDNTFAERLLLAPGENTFVIEAYDKLGKKTKKILKIIYKQEPQINEQMNTDNNNSGLIQEQINNTQ